MKVVLVDPSRSERHRPRAPSLGLAYLAGSLLQRGHEVTVVDSADGLPAAEIARRAAAADLVGITCRTVDIEAAVDIAVRIKVTSSVPIVAGGAHVNAVAQGALTQGRAFDFLCVGEGEELIADLAAAVASGGGFDRIPGLAYRRDGAVVYHGPRPCRPNRGALPLPAWHLFRLGSEIPIVGQRGCPFQGRFCRRSRSVASVLAEIEAVVARHHPAVIRFEDEAFGLATHRTKELLRGIAERGLDRAVRFAAQTRVDRIDDELLHLHRRAGFDTLEIGVHSGSPRILAAACPGLTLDQIEHAVRRARRYGLAVWCKFTVGHPGETIADLRDTVDAIARLNPDRLSVSMRTPIRNGLGADRADSLLLESVSPGQLRFFQIWSYLHLYLGNRRLAELARLLWNRRRLAAS